MAQIISQRPFNDAALAQIIFNRGCVMLGHHDELMSLK